MNEVIAFTPAQMWGWVLAMCGGIITIATVAGIVANLITKMKKPNVDQNTRLDNLERRMDEHDQFFLKDKRRLETMEDGNRVTQRALLALLDHSLDGNNLDQMREAKNELQKYLIER